MQRPWAGNSSVGLRNRKEVSTVGGVRGQQGKMRLDKSLLSSGRGRQANTQNRMVDVAMEGGKCKEKP